MVLIGSSVLQMLWPIFYIIIEHDEHDSDLLQQSSTQPETSVHDEEEASDKELQQGSEGEVGSNHEDDENSYVDTESFGTVSSV